MPTLEAPPEPGKAKAYKTARPAVRRIYRWHQIARPNQIAPEGDWFIWLILAGRGWGKTRTGAEWAAEKGRRYPGARIALVAETFADGRDTMVEGESGLLSVFEEAELRGGSREGAWNRSLGELYLANGTRYRIYSSEKPGQLRGPQHHFAWADEPAKFKDATKGPSEDTTWSNLEMGLRLSIDDSEPQAVATGTPKPVRLLTQHDSKPLGLLRRGSTVVTKGHTDENLANLARSFREEVVEPFRGTRLGDQELAAEILEDTPGALWARDWIETSRVEALPRGTFYGTVLALDPADGTEAGAEQAWCLAGIAAENHHIYIMDSEGMRTSALGWLKAAIHKARDADASIVVEKNHGGAYLVELLEQAMKELGIRVPYQTVTASEGKTTRAEKPAMLYEQGFETENPVVHHLGYFPELEDQMRTFTGGPGEKSPDRLDALVWAMTHLMGYSRAPRKKLAGVATYGQGGQVKGVASWQ